MGKAKKTKKDLAQEDSGESSSEMMQTEEEPGGGTAIDKSKKEKKKVTKNVSKDDSDSELDELVKTAKNKNTATKKKGKKKSKNDSDDDDDNTKHAAKSGFSILMGESDDEADEPKVPSESDDEPVQSKQPMKSSKSKKTGDEDKPAGGKKGKKARKKRNDSDEDIDKVLAELELEYSGQKPVENVVDESNQIKNVKSNERESIDEVGSKDGEEQDDDKSTVKTAAQKKKEKKERQKREAALLAQHQQQPQQQHQPQEEVNQTSSHNVVNEPESIPKKKLPTKKVKDSAKAETPPIDVDEGDVDKEEKKGKKKSKADRKEEEKEKGKKKGISSAMVAAMQERLAKVKEEEERLKREEELRIQREEELENMRLERLRLEAERKEKKKQREHERKARLKAEGKLLTAKQKQDKARAQAMLESLRAQGLELPEVGEKRPRPGTRVRPNKKKDLLQQSTSQEDANEEETKDDESIKGDEEEGEDTTNVDNLAAEVTEAEKVKDAWDASSSDDEPETLSIHKKSESDGEEHSEIDSDSDEESDEDADDDKESEQDVEESSHVVLDEIKRENAWERIMKRRHAAEEKRSLDNLRAAVVCVLGHVDTGKTKILDKLRRTNVQDCEAGGITQQIGATNVPIDAIKEQTRIVKGFQDMVFKLPGLLIIDTPGHESFSNLRSRGSSLCDIAILVVDIMHGLEPQTIESINLLKSKKTPFVVALNKIDRLYNWETMIRKDVREIIKNQAPNTQQEFQQRSQEIIVQFAEQGLNAALFYDNPDPRTYVNLVPTSAITGEGMGNLLYLIVESCQSWLAKRLMYSEELLATVLEVKAISGLGTTIDAILINGKLREGETMVIAGTDGPIVTQIRSLLMPQPMKELRVKNAYIEHKEIIAAQGVKIAAKELEKAIAGLNIYIANKPDEVDICRDEVAKELKSALSHIKLSSEGVYVQASTLGSLEALLEFLRTSKIPYSNIRIGPVVKRDVMKASTMLEHESQYATILAFDVKIERDAQDLADSLGVKIFQADIIYHLFDQFTAYREELKQKKREEFRSIAVFPCKLKILPQFIFNSRDPIVMGVIVEGGIIKEGTPICVPSKEFLDIGIVTSVEINKKSIESARKGQEVCIKIEPIPGESPKMFGRHFDENDMLTSKISRQSIDACKDYFRDDLLKADWALMVELKKLFQIL